MTFFVCQVGVGRKNLNQLTRVDKEKQPCKSCVIEDTVGWLFEQG